MRDLQMLGTCSVSLGMVLGDGLSITNKYFAEQRRFYVMSESGNSQDYFFFLYEQS